MPNFRPYNHDQTAMIVVNFKDQLQPGTFEYAIHHLIETKLDLSVFYPKYQNDDGGRPAYDPAILSPIRTPIFGALFCSRTHRAVCGSSARPDLCGGGTGNWPFYHYVAKE